MNVFVLDQNPLQAAQWHCDRHVLKMILEYGQMLSTAHRLLDGQRAEFTKPDGKKQVLHLMPGEVATLVTKTIAGDPRQPLRLRASPYAYVINQKVIYGVTHVNHPCSIWARETDANYHWLFMLFEGLSREYNVRYGKMHATARLRDRLQVAPRHITRGQQTPFVQAMPEEYKHDDVVEAYHRFYVGAKARFARWTNRPVPKWFERGMERQDGTILA